MKILHLATHLNRGGISQYMLSVGMAMRKKGHEVFVASSGGEMENEFKGQGIRVVNFPIHTKSELSPKVYFSLPKLIHWLKNECVDLIHAHTRVTQVMAFWVQCLTGKPFVTTAHGFYKPRLGRRILPAWGKRTIAISRPVAADLIEKFHVPAQNVRIIYNGIDVREFDCRFQEHNPREVRKEYGIPEKAPVVGVIARLVKDKGHDYLIRAIKTLERDFPQLCLIIVGDGRCRRALEDLARKLNLASRIFFIGNVRDVSKPIAAMDVFVLPAIWREGFGLSIVEAMTCKKPVIATDIWALNDIVENGFNGILVAPKDVAGLAQAIRDVLTNDSLREQLSREGRQTVEQRFALDRMTNEIENLYLEVCQNSRC